MSPAPLNSTLQHGNWQFRHISWKICHAVAMVTGCQSVAKGTGVARQPVDNASGEQEVDSWTHRDVATAAAAVTAKTANNTL